jgi:hypothetical protein
MDVFMDNSNQKIIKEIAGNLDCGMDCYYNSKTDEIIAIPNLSQVSDEEEFKKVFLGDLEKIKKQKSDFIKIEVLESFESFKIMERFVEQMTDDQFKQELENILIRKKPFQNFKHSIDNSDFRQNWFDFKQNELEEIVKNLLKTQKANTHQNL